MPVGACEVRCAARPWLAARPGDGGGFPCASLASRPPRRPACRRARWRRWPRWRRAWGSWRRRMWRTGRSTRWRGACGRWGGGGGRWSGGGRALGRAESAQLAARSRVLSAFNGCGGFEADGQPTIRTWLRWQTQITTAASHAATGWMRRLAVHPRVLAALGAARVTSSFARLICDWSDLLPPGLRDEADEILLAAAAGGATQADLRMRAREILERSATPDPDGPEGGAGDEDGFRDRRVWLDIHFRGAGKLSGDLTPECAAALTAVLDAVGKKAGPEDTRTPSQRRHDALEEACRRLVAGGLPDTAGQPTQVQLHVTLDQLRDLPGAADAERSWASARAAADRTPGWVYSRAAAEAYACDAQLIPVVTGHLDPAVLDAATDRYLAGFRRPDCACGGCTCPPGGVPAGLGAPPGPGGLAGPGALGGPAGLAGQSGPAGPCGVADSGSSSGAGARPCGPPPLSRRTRRRLQNTLLAYAADILS